MFLISSAKYIEPELRNIFGFIPPSFLPVANKRLYEFQLSLADNNEITISLPDDFNMEERDRKVFDNFNCEIIYSSTKISLGKSISNVINKTKRDLKKPLYILFGDSLFNKLSNVSNQTFVSETKYDYEWSSFNENQIKWNSLKSSDKENVICGFFSFSNPLQLNEIIESSNYDFIKSLDLYRTKFGLGYYRVKDWYDFGHYTSYLQSNSNFSSQRFFNSIKISSNLVEKSSFNKLKINAEINWFKKIPIELKSYTPHFLGKGKIKKNVSYKIERIFSPKLNDLYVYSSLQNKSWENIIDKCINFVLECSQYEDKGKSQKINNDLFLNKTMRRLSDFVDKNNISFSDQWCFNGKYVTINEIISFLKKWTPRQSKPNKFFHGDFCFSNIFFDFVANKIIVIDPRGLNSDDKIDFYGDPNYDIAKLTHSIIGYYDFILAGFHETKIDWNDKKIDFKINSLKKFAYIQTYFINKIKDQFNLSYLNLMAMQINLFLSMLTLHSDDQNRQNGLFANSFRLYFECKGNKK